MLYFRGSDVNSLLEMKKTIPKMLCLLSSWPSRLWLVIHILERKYTHWMTFLFEGKDRLDLGIEVK